MFAKFDIFLYMYKVSMRFSDLIHYISQFFFLHYNFLYQLFRWIENNNYNFLEEQKSCKTLLLLFRAKIVVSCNYNPYGKAKLQQFLLRY